MEQLPYCFVLMPFGTKPHPGGGAKIDFDRVYDKSLAPAIDAAGLHPYRDDLTAVGGIVQKQIYEALLLCDFAIADLTVENSNVFYELGVRHAARPSSTLAVSARPESIPFDVAHLRSVRYELDAHHVLTDQAAQHLRERVTRELLDLRRHVTERVTFADSPLFQLIEGWRPPAPTSMKTDLFASRVAYADQVKKRLALARAAAKRGGEERLGARVEVLGVQRGLGRLEDAEAGLLVDLLLTHRALEDWDSMILLAEALPGLLRERATVVEQLALALNRRAAVGREQDADRALAMLRELVDEGRATAETYGLIGRVHKDRWRRCDDPDARIVHLMDAIAAYGRGFLLDPSDVYPGINAVTLSLIQGNGAGCDNASRLLPVVEFSARRQLDLYPPTYWMFATLVETAVIRADQSEARHWLGQALRAVRESWEPKTTCQNLSDLLEAGAVEPEHRRWVDDLRKALLRAAPE